MRPSPTPDAFAQARQFFLDGLKALETGRFEAAEQRFLSSLALLPGRVSTLVNLAATQLKLSRPQDGPGGRRAGAGGSRPSDADAWFHKASALGQLNRHPEALLGLREGAVAGRAAGRRRSCGLRHGQTLQALGRPAARPRLLRPRAGRRSRPSPRPGAIEAASCGRLNRHAEAAHAFGQGAGARRRSGAAPLLPRLGLRRALLRRPAPGHYVETLFDDYADDSSMRTWWACSATRRTAPLAGTSPRWAGAASARPSISAAEPASALRFLRPMAERLTGRRPVEPDAGQGPGPRALRPAVHADIVGLPARHGRPLRPGHRRRRLHLRRRPWSRSSPRWAAAMEPRRTLLFLGRERRRRKQSISSCCRACAMPIRSATCAGWPRATASNWSS